MNLADLVKRSDRSVACTKGCFGAIVHVFQGRKVNAVRFDRNASLILAHAQEFFCLQEFPSDLGWTLDNPTGSVASIVLEALDDAGTDHVLADLHVKAKAHRKVPVHWPIAVQMGRPLHLRLTVESSGSVHLITSDLFNPRSKMLPLIRGKGVEIGPGANPIVHSGPSIDVSYVESKSRGEWQDLYLKSRTAIGDLSSTWARYVLGDARTLQEQVNDSLNFIFSNHVFEHLVNPIQVLESWSTKLVRGGLALGVVPDCRYTFDLRQRPSEEMQWRKEHMARMSEPDDEHYLRWCRHTSPQSTVSSLRSRRYSIHVHFYTPATFARLCEIACAQGWYTGFQVNAHPNNKDFGFVLTR